MENIIYMAKYSFLIESCAKNNRLLWPVKRLVFVNFECIHNYMPSRQMQEIDTTLIKWFNVNNELMTNISAINDKRLVTSIAVFTVCAFTEYVSQTPSSIMSCNFPVSPFTPHVWLPRVACLDYKDITMVA